uniref:RING-type domain-containing protein n=1 Tax=Chromera velia CCMP2878 TaxID=1169474 RepID=A0A0G4IDI4_9ALVE|eukprot:Cvel_13281.t1-p1 / transcript=Cvel_13281.t1 / gene=Cvel_13281 / organism=Chromera_velia_CCMP2878 / gene_product=hypothetical protein / transcript_product=hypothetical protein / location=Cvel_scaffold901:14247-19231(-) / protein_length=913 / sequence_SO=supercontig / SO=protein_coding / is_pseudo=false
MMNLQQWTEVPGQMSTGAESAPAAENGASTAAPATPAPSVPQQPQPSSRAPLNPAPWEPPPAGSSPSPSTDYHFKARNLQGNWLRTTASWAYNPDDGVWYCASARIFLKPLNPPQFFVYDNVTKRQMNVRLTLQRAREIEISLSELPDRAYTEGFPTDFLPVTSSWPPAARVVPALPLLEQHSDCVEVKVQIRDDGLPVYSARDDFFQLEYTPAPNQVNIPPENRLLTQLEQMRSPEVRARYRQHMQRQEEEQRQRDLELTRVRLERRIGWLPTWFIMRIPNGVSWAEARLPPVEEAEPELLPANTNAVNAFCRLLDKRTTVVAWADDVGQCSICMASVGSEEVVRLQCSHMFHKKCMIRWWLHKRKQGSSERLGARNVPVPCPICRVNVKEFQLARIKSWTSMFSEYFKREESCKAFEAHQKKCSFCRNFDFRKELASSKGWTVHRKEAMKRIAHEKAQRMTVDEMQSFFACSVPFETAFDFLFPVGEETGADEASSSREATVGGEGDTSRGSPGPPSSSSSSNRPPPTPLHLQKNQQQEEEEEEEDSDEAPTPDPSLPMSNPPSVMRDLEEEEEEEGEAGGDSSPSADRERESEGERETPPSPSTDSVAAQVSSDLPESSTNPQQQQQQPNPETAEEGQSLPSAATNSTEGVPAATEGEDSRASSSSSPREHEPAPQISSVSNASASSSSSSSSAEVPPPPPDLEAVAARVAAGDRDESKRAEEETLFPPQATSSASASASQQLPSGSTTARTRTPVESASASVAGEAESPTERAEEPSSSSSSGSRPSSSPFPPEGESQGNEEQKEGERAKDKEGEAETGRTGEDEPKRGEYVRPKPKVKMPDRRRRVFLFRPHCAFSMEVHMEMWPSEQRRVVAQPSGGASTAGAGADNQPAGTGDSTAAVPSGSVVQG